MEYDDLITKITKEVLTRLEKNIPLREVVKEKILILSEGTQLAIDIKDKLKLYEIDTFDRCVPLEEYRAVILPELTIRSIANLALGIISSDKEEFILRTLLHGKQMFIISEGIEYRSYEKSECKELYNLYKSYEERIKSFGAKIVTLKDLKSSFDGVLEVSSIKVNEDNSDSSEDKKQNVVVSKTDITRNSVKSILLNKKLISEGDLKKLYLKGAKEIDIIKTSIITPLAQDYIRIHKLKINRITGEE